MTPFRRAFRYGLQEDITMLTRLFTIAALLAVSVLPLGAQDITFSGLEITQQLLDVLHPAGDGSFLHFRNSRDVINAAIIQYGLPLRGIFISGGGGTTPDLVIPEGEFQQQSGQPNARAAGLKSYLLNLA